MDNILTAKHDLNTDANKKPDDSHKNDLLSNPWVEAAIAAGVVGAALLIAKTWESPELLAESKALFADLKVAGDGALKGSKGAFAITETATGIKPIELSYKGPRAIGDLTQVSAKAGLGRAEVISIPRPVVGKLDQIADEASVLPSITRSAYRDVPMREFQTPIREAGQARITPLRAQIIDLGPGLTKAELSTFDAGVKPTWKYGLKPVTAEEVRALTGTGSGAGRPQPWPKPIPPWEFEKMMRGKP